MMYSRRAAFIAISLLICGVGHTQANNVGVENDFDAWLQSDAGIAAVSNGYYDPEDRVSGIERYQQAKIRVQELQKTYPDATFSLQTPFALMTSDEFKTYLARSGPYPGQPTNFSSSNLAEFPDITIDWVTDKDKKQCVAPVKDQKSCGSCWAFSVVGALESTYCSNGNELIVLSEQQLVSCDKVEGGNDGCNGGLLTPAYNWIVKENKGGLCKAADYKYTATDSSCEKTCEVAKLGVKGSTVVKSEAAVVDILKLHPLAVAVFADDQWQFYSDGVITPADTQDINHGVVVVGYGTCKGKKYWKIRNSWGTSWGAEGYILLEVGHALSLPTYPTF